MPERPSGLQPELIPENGAAGKWADLLGIYTQRFSGRTPKQWWIFRGQGSSSWGLETYLERLLNRYKQSQSGVTRFEAEVKLIREFQRKAYQYVPDPPDRDDTLEWLSMMRHHGAPTRLLDWTYSFFVAAYFACESADEECVIWALDSTWCREQAKRILRERELIVGADAKEIDPLSVDGSSDSAKRFKALIMSPGVPLVYPVNPFRLNERITIQQGVFTCPGDVSVGFEENLVALGDTRSRLFKIRIERDAVAECLKELYRMNMSRATLYPGLDGFAWSLGTRLAFPETLVHRL